MADHSQLPATLADVSVDVGGRSSDPKHPDMSHGDSAPSLFHQMVAETIGTMFIVVFGGIAVHGAVLAQGAAGNLQVGFLFALGIIWGVYTTGMFYAHALCVLKAVSSIFWLFTLLGGFRTTVSGSDHDPSKQPKSLLTSSFVLFHCV